MVDKHNKSFFGQKNAIIIDSPSKNTSYIFLTCIKKKENGSWEKISKNEGKKVKCELEDMVMMLEVLSQKSDAWTTVHTFKEEKTTISLKWDKEKNNTLWVNIGNCNKKLNRANVEILRLLLKHIIKEKIEFATIPKNLKTYENKKANNNNKQIPIKPIKTEEFFEDEKNNDLFVVEQVDAEKEVSNVKAIITAETQKALLLLYNGAEEVWTPKSIILSKYGAQEKGTQTFTIESWFLKKNNIK